MNVTILSAYGQRYPCTTRVPSNTVNNTATKHTAGLRRALLQLADVALDAWRAVNPSKISSKILTDITQHKPPPTTTQVGQNTW